MVTSLPDFTLSASPTSVTIAVNTPSTVGIGVSPLNGFVGDVALSVDSVACSLNPSTILGGSGSSTLSCTFPSISSVTVTVTGTSGSLTHTVTVDYTVTDAFTLSASPTSVTIAVNTPSTVGIGVSPLNGFVGDVALSVDSVACSLNPSTILGGSGSSTLSCTFPSISSVTVTVTGTSGSLTHTVTVDYTVTDAFTLS